MSKKYSIKQEVIEHAAALLAYHDARAEAGPLARQHKKIAEQARLLTTSVEAGDYVRAGNAAFTIRRLSVDALSLDEPWVRPTNQAEKLLAILKGNYRCPYCNGHLRAAKARQCPECLRDWHDPDNVRRLDQPGE